MSQSKCPKEENDAEEEDVRNIWASVSSGMSSQSVMKEFITAFSMKVSRRNAHLSHAVHCDMVTLLHRMVPSAAIESEPSSTVTFSKDCRGTPSSSSP